MLALTTLAHAEERKPKNKNLYFCHFKMPGEKKIMVQFFVALLFSILCSEVFTSNITLIWSSICVIYITRYVNMHAFKC